MNTDTFRLVVSHGTAALLAVGGTVAIIWLIVNEQLETQSGQIGLPLLSGVVLAAVGFLWTSESRTSGEKAQSRATEDVAKAAERVAAAGTGNGHGTTVRTPGPVTTGGPTTVVADDVVTPGPGP